jgi:hypothetical protein
MKRAFCASLLMLGNLTAAPVWADPPCQSSGFFGGFSSRPVPMPAPLGTYVNGWHEAQVVGAQADQFVIYRQEWFQDGTKPGPYGSYHLQRITQRLASVPFQVIIEVDLRDEKINLARKTFVVSQLLAAGIADAQTRVVVGYPRAEGLYGDEAGRIFLLRYSGSQTGVGGAGGYGGGSSFGSGIGIPGGGLMGGFRGY